MIIGRDTAHLGPSAVKALGITCSSAIISWLPANSNHQHVVCVNNVEVRILKPGVYRHTINGEWCFRKYTKLSNRLHCEHSIVTFDLRRRSFAEHPISCNGTRETFASRRPSTAAGTATGGGSRCVRRFPNTR